MVDSWFEISLVLLTLNYIVLLTSGIAFVYLYHKYRGQWSVRFLSVRYNFLTFFRYFAFAISITYLSNGVGGYWSNCAISLLISRLLDFNSAIIIGIQMLWYKMKRDYLTTIALNRLMDHEDKVDLPTTKKTIKDKIKEFFYPSLEYRVKGLYQLKIYLLIKIPSLISGFWSLFRYGVSSDMCKDPLSQYGALLSTIAGFILLIVYGIKIRNMEDHYHLKHEFLSIAIGTYIPGIIGSFFPNFGLGLPAGNTVILMAILWANLCGFTFPVILTVYHLHFDEFSESSRSSSYSRSSKKKSLKAGNRKLTKWDKVRTKCSNEKFSEVFQSWIVRTQQTEIPIYISFWCYINSKYPWMTVNLQGIRLLSTLYMDLTHYLKHNRIPLSEAAMIPINLFFSYYQIMSNSDDPEKSNEAEKFLMSFVNNTFFVEINRQITDYLNHRVAGPFMASKEYKEIAVISNIETQLDLKANNLSIDVEV